MKKKTLIALSVCILAGNAVSAFPVIGTTTNNVVYAATKKKKSKKLDEKGTKKFSTHLKKN